MGSGIYEFHSPGGDKGKFVREPDGSIRYLVNDKWRFSLGRARWKEIVAAMDVEPLRNDDIPIVGEVIGWRCWRVYERNLWSLHQRQIWVPNEAQEGHVGAEVGGVYAFKTHARALSEAIDAKWQQPIVVGSVLLWGDAIEAENGWRAEYGRIASLDDCHISAKANQECGRKQEPIVRVTSRWWGFGEKVTVIERERLPIDRDELLTRLRQKYLTGNVASAVP